MIVFLTGQHAAGKTELAQTLHIRHKFTTLDLGPALRGHWQETSSETPFDQFILNQEQQFGTDYTDRYLLGKLRSKYKDCTTGLTVVGSRSMGGLLYLRDELNGCGLNNKIIWLESDWNTLYQRYCSREGSITPEKFNQMLDKDRRMGLLEIKKHADIVINNRGTTTVEGLYLNVAEHLGLLNPGVERK